MRKDYHKQFLLGGKMNKLGSNFMINNGLKEMAANAVELVVDEAIGLFFSGHMHKSEIWHMEEEYGSKKHYLRDNTGN
jgi:hypothetical protein